MLISQNLMCDIAVKIKRQIIWLYNRSFKQQEKQKYYKQIGVCTIRPFISPKTNIYTQN